MPLVGSSRMMTFGLVASHLAITTFCWLPPDSSPHRLVPVGRLDREPLAEAARRRRAPTRADSKPAAQMRAERWQA